MKTSTGTESGLGTTIAHYHLIEKIGEGGMGVVYKAEDTKLKRTVALKFLPPEMMRDKIAKARFLREAQTAAALDHPNICTIFEINEEGGRTFISMAYIEGMSLKERIAKGTLKVDEAKGIALQVAEGLRAAHARGVVHRDIKPANIMLTPEGQAKIMDFGLAKFDRGIDVTQTAAVMGTIAYMSPEQARGEAVDKRTDIWSFGTVLYEMLSGRLPFGKRPEQLLYFAILNEKPESLRAARPDVPRGLEQVVMKALEKDPAGRFQGMDEVLKTLWAAGSAATATTPHEPKKSIIVLPFENISPDLDQEYFCDGMTEEIITDLSHIHDLLVISRNSAMTFKGTKKKTREIAREANVRYVLEGSVRKAGNSLRITAQLIDAETDVHLWAEKYSGTLDDVCDIQEKVSRSIVGALKMRLTSDEDRRIASNPIPNVYAYECFLKARYELWRWTEEGLDRALDYLEKGLKISGENSFLLAGMGYVYFQYINSGFKTDDLTLKKAEEYTKRALELDPESPAGHIVLALLQGWSGKPQEAVARFKRALVNEPNNFDALVWFPCFCAYLGKTGAVEPYVDRLLAIEPLHPMTHFTVWLVKVMNGEFVGALDSMERTYGSYPNDPLIQSAYAQTLLYRRIENEARPVIDKLCQTAPDFLFGRLVCSLALGLRRKKHEALEILKDPKIEYLARRDFGYSYYVAEAYAAANEKKEALDWLEHALDLGFLNYPFLNELNPLLESIRGEPRFQKLMERVKREWEDFEV